MNYKNYFEFTGISSFYNPTLAADFAVFRRSFLCKNENYPISPSKYVVPARILHLSYIDYLRFCRDQLGAKLEEINGSGLVVPIFEFNETTNQFKKLLNTRVALIRAYQIEKERERKKENDREE